MASLRSIACAASITAAIAISSAAAAADPYPTKAVRIIVAAGAGATDDIAGRVVAAKLSELIGQPFFVENRPGAGGSIGQTFVMKSPPDGYTLLIAGGSMAGARYANANVSYDLLRDFTPISLLATSPFALAVNPALPVRDVKELIALAKAQPGKLTYGTIGAGQIPYWSVMLFNSMSGIQVMEVPYKATPDVITDVVAGRVDYYIAGVGSFLPVKDKLRILAVTTTTRSEALPGVPTMAEAGLPGYDMPSWVSVMGPAKLPREVVETLNAGIVKGLATAEVRERLQKAGFTAAPSTPEELRQRYENWMGIFGKIAKDVGLKPQ
jgi:tripartite-type tricarboxylate transporter receptor subunit TctC